MSVVATVAFHGDLTRTRAASLYIEIDTQGGTESAEFDLAGLSEVVD